MVSICTIISQPFFPLLFSLDRSLVGAHCYMARKLTTKMKSTDALNWRSHMQQLNLRNCWLQTSESHQWVWIFYLHSIFTYFVLLGFQWSRILDDKIGFFLDEFKLFIPNLTLGDFCDFLFNFSLISLFESIYAFSNFLDRLSHFTEYAISFCSISTEKIFALFTFSLFSRLSVKQRIFLYFHEPQPRLQSPMKILSEITWAHHGKKLL